MNVTVKHFKYWKRWNWMVPMLLLQSSQFGKADFVQMGLLSQRRDAPLVERASEKVALSPANQ